MTANIPNIQVTCVTKPDRDSRHEHITHLGGIHNGQRWLLTREETISWIELKRGNFYVIDGKTGKAVWIDVVKPTFGHSYLRTYANKVGTDNLLALDECPLA